MKKYRTVTVGCLVSLSALLLSTAPANAGNISSHGCSAAATNGSDASKLTCASSGLVNTGSSSPINVTMPIARVATTAGGSQNVYIDGYTQSYSAAMACFLATIDDHGYLLTTKSFNTPANNGNTGRNWEVSLSLTGAEAPVW